MPNENVSFLPSLILLSLFSFPNPFCLLDVLGVHILGCLQNQAGDRERSLLDSLVRAWEEASF